MIPVKSGRVAQPITLTAVRELSRADLLRLATEPSAPVAAPALQRLRAPHHAAARLLAAGKSAMEVAVIVGRTPQRIRDLQKDPTFQELVAYYADQITTADISDASRLNRKLNIIAESAAEEIIDRLSDPVRMERVPMSELRQLTEMGADRTTNPPKTAVPVSVAPQHITFNIAGTIDRKLASLPASAEKVIEHAKAPLEETKDHGPDQSAGVGGAADTAEAETSSVEQDRGEGVGVREEAGA